jgi:SAM-dependent methyltransferase
VASIAERLAGPARTLLGPRFDTLLWLKSPLRRPIKAYVKRYGLTVRHGPLAGLTYGPWAMGRVGKLVPKLLGAYERDWHEALATVVAARHETIVDIGCAEGYFAVGLALASPDSTVYAYDIEPKARELCGRLAELNGVADRMRIGVEADIDTLRGLPLAGAFVLCDCEGCEAQILDPDRVPQLRESTLVVELHDFIDPTIPATVLGRFEESHSATLFEAQPRYIRDYEELPNLPGTSYLQQEMVLSEHRPTRMRWALLTPRSAAQP